MEEMENWLSAENLSKAKGKTRDEIFNAFGNIPQPIAYIPMRYLPVLGSEINDNRVYSGMGYFIDHVVNHHPNIGIEKYAAIQEVLSSPDNVKEMFKEGKRSVAFIKKISRYNAVIVQVEAGKDGKMIFHKSFLEQRKEPYATLKSIRPLVSSADGATAISRAEKSTPGRSLSARNDDAKVQKKMIPTNKIT
ncbi:hypothetical protein AGMMS4957_16170 [Bacteroidia bacterium]|nr:hypothetical protein AGMMS4957_16170 [Bacteroidia bacterium]